MPGGQQPVDAWRYVGVGLTLALSTMFFGWLGLQADDAWGTDPWLTLGGAFVGAVAGFWYLYRELVVIPREQERERKR